MDDAKQHLDVVICGGGIMGTCTAFFLAKRGVFSIVVEKDEVANAASGKAGGFLARNWNSGSPINELAEASFDLHAELAKELDGENQYGYRRVDSHSITLRDGCSYDKACHSRLPNWLDGEMVQKPTSKIGTKETNAQVHPYKFCQALRNYCSNMGVVFITNSEVTNIVCSQEHKPTVITINGSKEISADITVLTMGPWTGLANKWFPTLTSSIYGQKAHSITVIPTVPITADAIFASYGDSSPDIYPRPDGEAYVCGIVEPAKRSSKLDPAGCVTQVPGACAKLKTLAVNMSSALEEGNVNVEQACYLPLTQDGLPLIGQVPQCTGVYVAAGHGCWGILNGPITGKSLSELIIDGTSAIDLSPFDPARFKD